MKGHLWVAAALFCLGGLIYWGSYELPTGGGYAQVGPGVVPRIVAGFMLLVGALLLREAFTGGFRGLDEAEERGRGMDWAAFAWIGAGLVAYGLLIERLGFVLSSAVLFAMVARGMASRRWALNLAIGLVLAIAIFAIFNYGLGLTLPAGVLKPLLA
ncbi:MAG TPA: tripartite tricarboxylate transporter TctB family protein [Usitatibacter sp.]|nr:tripartite tricarboxylate transporter TctB family protein [Usitatibacter sp.]